MAHTDDVTVNNTQVGATQTGVPFVVDLSQCSATFWSTVKSDGSDIRVYEEGGTVEVPRDVRWFDGVSDTGYVFIKGDLSSLTDTVFEIHVDGTSSEPVSGDSGFSEDVWTAYGAVYHCEDGTDATGNGNTIGANGGATSGAAGGIYDSALDCGSGANFDRADSATLKSSEYIVQTWIKVVSDVADTFGADVVRKNGSYILRYREDLSPVKTGVIGWNGGSAVRAVSTTEPTIGTLAHYAMTQKSGTLSYWLDGVEIATASASSPTNTTDILILGGYSFGSTDADVELSDVRIQTTVPTDVSGYMETQYNNQSAPNTFSTVSAAGGVGSTVSPFGLQSIGSQFGPVAAARLNGVMQQ